MTPERYAQIKAIFLQTCERPLAQRPDFLCAACKDDKELRAAVEELLRNHTEPQATQSAADPAATAAVASGKAAENGARWATGQVIAGRYRIVDLLGSGGMGQVYRADDLQLRQTVALKFLPPALAQDDSRLERLRQEVRLARQITHQNVCRVYDFGAADGQHFISMEYVDGENLKTLLSRIGRLPGDKAMQITREMCAGLAAAHARNVLHRDLKPANIMLDGRGQVRITDFGLAAHPGEVRGREVFSGTPGYMAPEQLTGRAVSVRSDLYSLGLVLYELFTGQAPFHADSVAEYAQLRAHSRALPPSRLIPDMDSGLERVIMSCLEPLPEDRPADVLAVVAALPGSDLLAAALAAGLTPSPDMVARACIDAPVSRTRATASLALFAVLVFAATLLSPCNHPLCQMPAGSLSPQVLAQRARDILHDVQPTSVSDEASGFVDHVRPGTQLGSVLKYGSSDVSYAVPAGNELVFWYRASPTLFAPGSLPNVLFGGARVALDDPPLNDPGMAQVILDSSGRLLGLQVVPPLLSDATSADTDVNWTSLLQRAGVDASTLTPCALQTEPPVPADAALAWQGYRTGDETPICVEVAQRGSRPVYLATLAAHSSGVERIDSDAVRRAILDHGWQVLLGLCALASIPLARMNIQRSRSDLYGAWRVAAFVFAVRMLSWLLQAQHVAEFERELTLLSFAVIGGLAEAMLLWLFYVALEPYARRYWPHLLVSWNRLWRGRFGDPLVAQQVLVGTALGAALAVLAALGQPVASWLGLPLRDAIRADSFFVGLASTRYALGGDLDLLRTSIYDGLSFLLLLVVLRMLLRRAVWAAILGALIIAPLTVPRGGNAALSWLFLGGGVALLTWCLVRFGLLTAVTGLFVAFVLARAPLTFHLGAWYGDLSLVALALTVVVALYGFLGARGSMPPRPAI